MEKDTLTQDLVGDDQVDRTLSISCRPTLTWNSWTVPYNITGTMVYTQTGSNPQMGQIVDPSSGDINLRNMPNNSNYNDNVDIYMTLDTSGLVDHDGNPISGRWALSGEGTMPGMGAAWFINPPPVGGPIDYTPIPNPTGMSIDRQSDALVVIDDDTGLGTPTYAFCTGLVLPGFDNYFMAFEPLISGKGKGGNSFMLKE